MRLAEVWMDDYKEYFYTREPQIRKLDIGDISEQILIRQKLQCKPFSYFMEKIAYDLPKKFPFPPKNKVWGEVKTFIIFKANKNLYKKILFVFFDLFFI